MCFPTQQRALFRHLNFQKWSECEVSLAFSVTNVLRATTACTFSTSQLPKVVREWCVLYILTSKCASRHNSVHFFNISTCKSGPRMVCFVHFDFKMCFAPQRRALFRHLNFQKWSENGVFCTFWLQNVLRATTACTFSTSQLPKVVRTWCVLYILTSTCASRYNGLHFFISHLASWLRTRRFSEPTFRPSGATNHWKNAVFRDFPTFSRTCIFSLLTLSLPWSSLFYSSLFYSSLLSDSSHLCFSSVHIVGSLTSKLPSMIVTLIVSMINHGSRVIMACPDQNLELRRQCGLVSWLHCFDTFWGTRGPSNAKLLPYVHIICTKTGVFLCLYTSDAYLYVARKTFIPRPAAPKLQTHLGSSSGNQSDFLLSQLSSDASLNINQLEAIKLQHFTRGRWLSENFGTASCIVSASECPLHQDSLQLSFTSLRVARISMKESMPPKLSTCDKMW